MLALYLTVNIIYHRSYSFNGLCIHYVGTEFMAKLHEQLKYFVARKVSSDRMWQGLRIYLSGHEVIVFGHCLLQSEMCTEL